MCPEWLLPSLTSELLQASLLAQSIVTTHRSRDIRVPKRMAAESGPGGFEGFNGFQGGRRSHGKAGGGKKHGAVYSFLG